MHFGRRERSAERRKEADLISCLEAHAESVEHLYLVGDVFDGYIEYNHLVPKGFVRFQALLARWTDRGIPVTYLLGNHDSWHQDYFSRELDVTTVADGVSARHHGVQLYLTHGDAQASSHSTYGWIRPFLRHPLLIRLYRSLLPADLGMGLAQRVSRALYDGTPDEDVITALRSYARDRLQTQETDIVVMGHSHEARLHHWPEGSYVNIGNWYEDRTFARLDHEGLHLLQWNGARALDIEATEL